MDRHTRAMAKKSIFFPKKRLGFTLTELAIVMTVIGSILSTIWWAASNAQESQRENNGYTELQTVAQNIGTLLGGRTFPSTYDYPNNGYTALAIANLTLPSTYVDSASGNAKANNPWALDGFSIYIPNATLSPTYTAAPFNEKVGKVFRLNFKNVPIKGCIALLLKMTTCQAGQSGCPVAAYTNFAAAADACVPGQTNCPNAAPAMGGATYGWQSMSLTAASQMCGDNPANAGSVDFDYTL